MYMFRFRCRTAGGKTTTLDFFHAWFGIVQVAASMSCDHLRRDTRLSTKKSC
jgi:hypothetical protein